MLLIVFSIFLVLNFYFWWLSTVSYVIHWTSKKQILDIAHNWCRAFYCILIGPTEFKISHPKGNPFHDTFYRGLHGTLPFKGVCVQLYITTLSEGGCLQPPFTKGCASRSQRGLCITLMQPYVWEDCIQYPFRGGHMGDSCFNGNYTQSTCNPHFKGKGKGINLI